MRESEPKAREGGEKARDRVGGEHKVGSSPCVEREGARLAFKALSLLVLFCFVFSGDFKM